MPSLAHQVAMGELTLSPGCHTSTVVHEKGLTETQGVSFEPNDSGRSFIKALGGSTVFFAALRESLLPCPVRLGSPPSSAAASAAQPLPPQAEEDRSLFAAPAWREEVPRAVVAGADGKFRPLV